MNSADVKSNGLGVDDLRDLIGELRIMARGLLQGEGHRHSFTPTALAMSALRRAKQTEQDWTEVRWENRAHFFSALAIAMRHALIDHARRRRSCGREKIFYLPPDEIIFNDLPTAAEERPENLLQVEEAVGWLQSEDQRLGDVIHQFYYAGYTIPEMAAFSGVSEKTVDRDLKRARALLRKFFEKTSRAA